MKNIIVPTDFSPASENALSYAIHLAGKLGSPLRVVYAHKDDNLSDSEFLSYDPHLPMASEVHANFTRIADRMSAADNLKYDMFLQSGSLSEVITSLSNEDTLLIIGKDAVNEIDKDIWRKSSLLIVPSAFEFKSDKLNFIFATDLERINDWDILENFKEMAIKLNATITLFFVVKDKDRDVESIEFEAQRKIIYKQYFEGVNVEVKTVHEQNVVSAVENFALEVNASLITMVSHEHGFIQKIFHKSVTREMAINTHVPFLGIPDKRTQLNQASSTNYW